MKKIKYTIGSLLLSVLFSCNSFLDLENYQNTPTEDAYNTVQDVKNGANGAYYALGDYTFYGRNVVALGDMAADNANAGKAAGHFVTINQYTFAVTDQYIRDIWTGGYQVMDRTTRTIQGANRILAGDEPLSERDVALLYSYQSQCYALRALAAHVLVNVYGLPYQAGMSNDQPGIVIIPGDTPIPVLKNVARSTVEQTYAQILADIASAKTTQKLVDGFNAGQSGTDQVAWNQFYLQTAGLYALEARVALFMGNYSGAINAADSAILLRNSAEVSNEQYLKMWTSIAINDEDIFTIAKSEKDNLSANSLNTLYGSYGGTLTDTLVRTLEATDIRLQLIVPISRRPKKFAGIPTNASVNNIPVFRKSEMYLVLAEAYARSGDEVSARTALLLVAQRNTAVTATVLDALSGADLLVFIAAERRRELFEEGFRWFDTRRTGEIIKVANGVSEPFDIAKFVYPIPAAEINSGFGVVQNDNWEDNMPVFP